MTINNLLRQKKTSKKEFFILMKIVTHFMNLCEKFRALFYGRTADLIEITDYRLATFSYRYKMYWKYSTKLNYANDVSVVCKNVWSTTGSFSKMVSEPHQVFYFFKCLYVHCSSSAILRKLYIYIGWLQYM